MLACADVFVLPLFKSSTNFLHTKLGKIFHCIIIMVCKLAIGM